MAKKLKFVGKPVATPAAPAKAEAKTKPEAKSKAAPKKEKTERPKRFAGVTTGLGVLAYQNKSLFDNAKKKLTDDQLAADWRREFPNAIAEYTAETVNGVRNLVNRGKHGNPDNVPVKPLHAWDENGQPVANWGEKGKAKAEAKAAKAEAEAKPVKKVKKVKSA